MRALTFFLLGGAVLPAAMLPAQTCKLVKDINTVAIGTSSVPRGARSGPGLTFAPGFVKCGKYWFFVATTAKTGQELWRTDGKTCRLVKDINPGTGSSGIFYLVCCRVQGKELLFFRANDGKNGSELWRSDGTVTGTVLVGDIFPGAGSSSPSYLECMGGRVYFAASDGRNGFELWSSDGTAKGTLLVKDIRTGVLGSSPRYLRANSSGNAIYFQATDGIKGNELWRTDGTAKGTVLVKDILPGPGGSGPQYFNNLGSLTIFRASGPQGSELWRTDGTSSGTVLVRDIRLGAGGSFPNLFYPAQIGKFFYFSADDGSRGSELWRTDGTRAGTSLVADIRPGFFGSFPSAFHVAGNTLFFRAFGASGRELYKLGGTTVSLVADIRPGLPSSSPYSFGTLGRKTLFTANDGKNGAELWITDGSTSGTRMVADIATGSPSSAPSSTTVLSSGAVMFAASDAAHGNELWISDGTRAGTRLLCDIEPERRTFSSFPNGMTCSFGNFLIFAATDGRTGSEPWIQDANGTRLLKDVRAGIPGSLPGSFTPCWNGKEALVFFSATGSNGTELWVTDGTTAGTRLVKDIRAGNPSSFPGNLVCCDNRVFFTANDGRSGTELWVSDGTAAGTKLVKDIRPGSSGSFPSNLVCCKGKLFFTANDGRSGTELWVSDGTAAGTRLVKDIEPGPSSSSPSSLVCGTDAKGNTFVYFSAFTSGTRGTGRELWRSDGTAAGTGLVKDIWSGSWRASSFPMNLVRCGDRLFFVANDGRSGAELWVSDGTAAGTRLVKDIQPGSKSSSPSDLVCCGNRIFFTANDGSTGLELWVSDGSSAGTRLVKNIQPGSSSSSPSRLTCVGNRVYFSALFSGSGASGRELWVSDGTSAGTRLVCDIWPGITSSSPTHLAACCGKLYFQATAPLVGSELFMLEAPGAYAQELGQGSARAFSTMHATPPVIGRTAILEGASGPRGYVGVVLLSPPVARPYLVPPRGSGWIAWPPLGPFALVLGLVQPPSWSLPLPIPNRPGLVGVKLNTQTWWVDLRTIFPLEVSNGVQLVLGK